MRMEDIWGCPLTPGIRILATYPSAVQGLSVALKMTLPSLDILLKVTVEDKEHRPVFDSSVDLTGVRKKAVIFFLKEASFILLWMFWDRPASALLVDVSLPSHIDHMFWHFPLESAGVMQTVTVIHPCPDVRKRSELWASYRCGLKINFSCCSSVFFPYWKSNTFQKFLQVPLWPLQLFHLCQRVPPGWITALNSPHLDATCLKEDLWSLISLVDAFLTFQNLHKHQQNLTFLLTQRSFFYEPQSFRENAQLWSWL